MDQFELYSHTNRNNFDPYGKAMKQANITFRHKDHIEDYWDNCRDEFDVLRRIFSRLPLKLIRLYKVVEVPEKVQDDEVNLVQHHDYETQRRKPFPPINWSKEEVTDLDQVTKLVKKYSRLWVNHKVLELEAGATKFTYDLMGELGYQYKKETKANKGDETTEPHEEDVHEEGHKPMSIKRRTRIQAQVKQGEKPSPKIKNSPQVSINVVEGETSQPVRKRRIITER